nr:YggT family protein [Inquilinus limosus]
MDPLFRIIDIVLQMYVWVVIAAAILSWLVAFNVVNARNQVVYQIGNALYRLTEPALRPIRRFLPNLGGIDISPVVLLLIIYFLQMVLRNIYVALLTG